MSYVTLILSAVLIIMGADQLTKGASALAKHFRISDMVIGLTVVAFGTSMPELVVSSLSALKGSSELAIGNIVGSNIFNTLVIVGCTALVMPILITRRTLKRDIPLTILASAALFIMCNTVFFDGAEDNTITRTDGMVLLLFFAIFMAYTFAIASGSESDSVEEIKRVPLWKSCLSILVGFAALIGGGNLFVSSASDIARAWGVSESVIALTIVACGTSLPELATSVVAAYRHKPEIAIGNVIGSNLFNIFFVLGTSAVIRPLPLGNINNMDLSLLLISSVILWLVSFGDYRIRRWEGGLMISLFAVYLAYTVMNAVV